MLQAAGVAAANSGCSDQEANPWPVYSAANPTPAAAPAAGPAIPDQILQARALPLSNCPCPSRRSQLTACAAGAGAAAAAGVVGDAGREGAGAHVLSDVVK